MRAWGKALVLGAVCTAGMTAPSLAVEQSCTDDAMIVFDGSGSMAEMGFNDIDEPRIFDARRAMERAIPPVAQVRRLGLMIYGPAAGESCDSVDLRFPPIPDAARRIIAEVNGLQPAGETPLTEAVRQAAELLLAGQGSGTVVLVTDGNETCGGAPCQLAAELAGEGVILHVIGFKVRGSHFSWNSANGDYRDAQTVAQCLADRTGGIYVGVETVDQLVGALRKTLGCNLLF